MESHTKLVNWIFSVLVAIVSFFLVMFFIKVNTIADNIQQLTINNAVNEIKLNSLNERMTKVERAITEFTQQQQLK